jgi:hypothetical protein
MMPENEMMEEKEMVEHRGDVTKHAERHEYKWRKKDGITPNYRALHEVFITRDLGSERNQELVSFINQHINEYKGIAGEKHGIPSMLFERKQDAQQFADALHKKLNIPVDHIAIKASKIDRSKISSQLPVPSGVK